MCMWDCEINLLAKIHVTETLCVEPKLDVLYKVYNMCVSPNQKCLSIICLGLAYLRVLQDIWRILSSKSSVFADVISFLIRESDEYWTVVTWSGTVDVNLEHIGQMKTTIVKFCCMKWLDDDRLWILTLLNLWSSWVVKQFYALQILTLVCSRQSQSWWGCWIQYKWS